MRCESFRLGHSARLDSEALPPGLDDDALDRHLGSCPACRVWTEGVTTLRRLASVHPAPTLDDRTDALLAAVPLSARPRPTREWARYALLSVGLLQILMSLPALLMGDGHGSVHMAREMGAIDLAIGVGFVSAAWRPRLGPGLLPFTAALVAATALTSLLDLVSGHAGAGGETRHAIDVVGLLLLWALPLHHRLVPARRTRLAPA